MNGVEIICSEVVNDVPRWAQVVFKVHLAFSILLCIILVVCMVAKLWKVGDIIIKILWADVFFCFALLCLIIFIPDVPAYTKYYAIVDENASIKEIESKYEIIERHGELPNLYELREIEEVEY